MFWPLWHIIWLFLIIKLYRSAINWYVYIEVFNQREFYMTALPVIVGMGGVNAAGRTSFHQGFRRIVID